jgi:CRP/FNR family transcriptional regulator, cyclic AMP receptor protein
MSYDPAVALDFFRAAGTAVAVPKSKVVFSEKEGKKSFFGTVNNKIYYLVDGEVALLAGSKTIGTVKPGEIFGELAAITNAPRTATAMAKTDCSVIGLDHEQFELGLSAKPTFALMLMSLLIARLRESIARLTAAGSLGEGAGLHESAAFDAERLSELVSGLANDPPIYYQQGRQIVAEGSKAVLMYAVVKGRVAISIGGKLVERLGPGGAFGEAALVEQVPRMASAVAETDCELQPINRQAFLSLVKSTPQFASGVLASLAERLRFLTERLK